MAEQEALQLGFALIDRSGPSAEAERRLISELEAGRPAGGGLQRELRLVVEPELLGLPGPHLLIFFSIFRYQILQELDTRTAPDLTLENTSEGGPLLRPGISNLIILRWGYSWPVMVKWRT